MIANGQQYRGLGHKVAGMTTDQALQAAGLDWKTIPMPMLIQGKAETRPSQFRALVRSDNGVELGVATRDYKPMHNAQILEAMCKVAEVGRFELETAGSLDEGRRVWATGSLPDMKFTLGADVGATGYGPGHRMHAGDTTRLEVLMGSGHVPGMAFTIQFVARRVICENGAVMDAAIGKFRLTHAATFGSHITRLQGMMANAGAVLGNYESKARRMAETKISEDQGRTYIVQLMQPELIREMVEEHALSGEILTPGNGPGTGLGSGRPEFNGIDTGRLIAELPSRIKFREYKRPVNRVLELVAAQPGHELNPGTLWNQYNAVTYFVDHERGRSADSGLNAALFGEGAQLKAQALTLATQYAEVLAAR